MLLSLVGDSLTNNQARIADRLGTGQDAEAAGREVTKSVEIEHLAVRVKESMLRAVARHRGSDNHSCRVVPLSPRDATGRARCAPECSQIGDAIA